MSLAAEPQRAADHASHAAEQFFNEVKVLHGIAVIAQDGQLTTGDGARLAKATVVIRTTGQMAAGAHASEVMRTRTADVPGPIGRESAAIAMEKSAQSTSKPSEAGVTGT